MAFLGGILRHHLGRIAVVSVLSLAAAVCQIAFVFLLFRMIAGSQSMSMPWLDLTGPDGSVGMVVALALLSAALPFATQRYIIHATTTYLRNNVRWFRTKLADMSTRYAILGLNVTRSDLVRVMSSEIRYASLSYSSVLQIILPATLFGGALVVMFHINSAWTGVLLLMLVPFAVVGALVVVSGIRRNRDLRAAAVAHSQAAADFVSAVSLHFSANRWGGELGRVADRDYSWDYARAYGRRLNLGVLTTLVMDVLTFAIVALVGILVVQGRLDLQNAAGIVIYGLVVRFALGKLTSCISLSISVVSQLPYYETYIRLRNQIDRMAAAASPADGPSPIPRATPARVAMVHPDGVGWISAHAYLSDLHPGLDLTAAMRSVVLLSSTYPPLFSDFQRTFQIAPEQSPESLSGSMPSDASRDEEFEQLMSLKDGEVSRAALLKLSGTARFFASFHYVMRRGVARKYVFVSLTDYLKLLPGERARMDETLAAAHCVFVNATGSAFRRLQPDMDAVRFFRSRPPAWGTLREIMAMPAVEADDTPGADDDLEAL